MKPICLQCQHNCTPQGEKKIQGCIANKPKSICWCNANGGRAITKKYSKCPYFLKKEGDGE